MNNTKLNHLTAIAISIVIAMNVANFVLVVTIYQQQLRMEATSASQRKVARKNIVDIKTMLKEEQKP